MVSLNLCTDLVPDQHRYFSCRVEFTPKGQPSKPPTVCVGRTEWGRTFLSSHQELARMSSWSWPGVRPG